MARIGVAVVGAGFMGGVHAEALRRAGCEVVGVLGVSDAESTKFAAAIGAPKAYRSLEGAARRPGRRVGPHRHPEQAALRDGEGRARGRQARAVREAAGHDLEGDGRARGARPASTRSRRPASTTTSASTRCPSRPASGCAAGELGKVHHVTGSYVQDWLLLDTDYNWRVLAGRGRRAAGGGRHRHALARPRPRDHRPRGRGRLRRPADRPPGAPPAEGRGRDLQRQARQGGRPRAGRRSRPRTTAPSCCASRAARGARSWCRR